MLMCLRIGVGVSVEAGVGGLAVRVGLSWLASCRDDGAYATTSTIRAMAAIAWGRYRFIIASSLPLVVLYGALGFVDGEVSGG